MFCQKWFTFSTCLTGTILDTLNFNEREPVFATSTQHKNYYTRNDIPFHTYDDREKERNEHHRRLKEGLPPAWNHHRERAYNQTAQYGATAFA